MVRYGVFVVGPLFIALVACGGEGLQPGRDADGTGGRAGGTGGASGRSAGVGGLDPTTAPPTPQAAVALEVGVMPGKVCSHTNGYVSMPMNVAGVLEALNCDLSRGCRPDEFVVVDRDRGSTVSCTVAPSGASFTVSARLSVDGSSTGDPSLTFGLSGVLSPAGGMASVSEQNSVGMGGGTDSACTVTISPPRGLVKSGGIWGNVQCDDFRNPTDISETGCALSGTFLFENCTDPSK